MLFTRKKFQRKKTKKVKINPSVVVCSDDFLLLDLLEQFFDVCCCSVLTFALEDSNHVITTKLKSPLMGAKKRATTH